MFEDCCTFSTVVGVLEIETDDSKWLIVKNTSFDGGEADIY
jgi:hypothetical protein